VASNSSDRESGSLANVATRNVLGCFSISIYRFTLACSSSKRHLHELRYQPPLPLGGALLFSLFTGRRHAVPTNPVLSALAHFNLWPSPRAGASLSVPTASVSAMLSFDF